MSEDEPRDQKDKREGKQLRLSGFETFPGQDNGAKETAEQDRDDKENRTPMPNFIYRQFFENKSAAWTAWFTFVLAIFSLLLWRVSNDANNTSTATQRAFITFAGVYLEPVVNNGVIPTGPRPSVTGYRIHLPMVNSGTTPTKYSTYEMAAAVRDASPNDGTDFDFLPQTERYPFIFGPHQSYDSLGAEIFLRRYGVCAREGEAHLFLGMGSISGYFRWNLDPFV
jgi:hypothetical protein